MVVKRRDRHILWQYGLDRSQFRLDLVRDRDGISIRLPQNTYENGVLSVGCDDCVIRLRALVNRRDV